MQDIYTIISNFITLHFKTKPSLKFLFTAILLLHFNSTLFATNLLSLHNFQDTPAASDVAGNVTISNVTISAGNVNYQDGNDDGGSRIGNSGSWNQGNFSDGGKYLQFSISPDSEYALNYESLTLRFGRTGVGPQQVTIQYSLDGFTTAGITILSNGNVTSENQHSLNSFTIASTELPTGNVTSTLTIRIWGHNASGTGNFRFNNFRVFGEVIDLGGPLPCINETGYFRTKATGNWMSETIWESSPDGVNNWGDATCPPDENATSITINTDHTVTINSDISFSNTIIETGGILNWIDGELTIGYPGENLTIYGTFIHNTSNSPPLGGSEIFRIKTNGVLDVRNNNAPSPNQASQYGLSTQVIYEDGAVFHWNVSSNAFFLSNNAIYFPNAGANEIPIFRVTAPNIVVGANAITRINGLFEVTQNTVTFQNSGNKIFRNGITGDGNVTQSSGSGDFILDGNTAFLGGSGAIDLLSSNSPNLLTNGGVYIQMLSDKIINNGQFRITNPATLDAGPYELSGTGNIRFKNSATLITQHADGVDGTLSSLNGGVNFESTNEQTIIFERNGNQNSGITHLPNELGTVIVRNGSKLTLQKDLSITNLTNGFFEVTDENSELIAPNSITINIHGNLSFILSNGGTMNDNCLVNLRFTTGGISSTAVFTGNGETIKCWNFNSSKSNSGGVILSNNTPLYCANNFEVDYFGGSAVFTDNGNTIIVGDDVRLKGGTSNFNFTGTLILTLENSGDGQADIEVESANNSEAIQAHLNNLIINNTTNSNANVRFQPTVNSGTITIKNNLTIENMPVDTEILLGSNTFNIGGDYTNFVSSSILNEGTSTVIFNRNGNQQINMPDGGEHFYNLILSGSGDKILNNEDIYINNNLLIDDNNSRLSQPNNTQIATNGCDHFLYIAGDITLENNGSFATNCFDNLEIQTFGNNNQIFNGNGSDFLCFNFRADKEDGNLSLAANTHVHAKNNFRIKMVGSNHIFSDGSNTISLGDDLILTGSADRFNLTGTFIMTGLNGATNDIENENSDGVLAELNNLIIEGSGTNNHTRIHPNNGSHTLIVKGSVILENNSAGLPVVLNTRGNNIHVGGNWVNHGTLQTFNSSTVTFNGTGTQLVDAGGNNTGKHFYNVVKTNSGIVVQETDIAIENDFTLNDGTWDVSNDNFDMYVQRNWMHTSGTFASREGRVVFYGILDSEIQGVDFHRLHVNKNNTSLNTSTSNSFSIEEKLFVDEGNFLIKTNHTIDALRVRIENQDNELRIESNARLNVNVHP